MRDHLLISTNIVLLLTPDCFYIKTARERWCVVSPSPPWIVVLPTTIACVKCPKAMFSLHCAPNWPLVFSHCASRAWCPRTISNLSRALLANHLCPALVNVFCFLPLPLPDGVSEPPLSLLVVTTTFCLDGTPTPPLDLISFGASVPPPTLLPMVFLHCCCPS